MDATDAAGTTTTGSYYYFTAVCPFTGKCTSEGGKCNSCRHNPYRDHYEPDPWTPSPWVPPYIPYIPTTPYYWVGDPIPPPPWTVISSCNVAGCTCTDNNSQEYCGCT